MTSHINNMAQPSDMPFEPQNLPHGEQDDIPYIFGGRFSSHYYNHVCYEGTMKSFKLMVSFSPTSHPSSFQKSAGTSPELGSTLA